MGGTRSSSKCTATASASPSSVASRSMLVWKRAEASSTRESSAVTSRGLLVGAWVD